MLYHLLFPLSALFSGFNVFRYITFRCIGAALTAFILVLMATPQFIRLIQRYQIGQVVRNDGPATHFVKQGVPTMGGLLILLTIMLTTLLWANLTNHYIWLLLAVTLWFGIIGFIDDFRKFKHKNSHGLSPRGKMFLQLTGASLVGLHLYLHPSFDTHLSVPFFKELLPDLGWSYIIFAVLVIVGASNAVNLTDGLDGLAVGPTVITATVYLIFSYLAGHAILANYLQIPYVPGAGEVAVFCGALAGSSLGFLWYNAFPAQIFMGDVGSLALGGALGAVAIITKQEILLAIVGGIFVMEA
ncbi:MAG: phospho-N-acetylmuramoyl-pentapeptide-transferase, partial [Chloroflexi bacterium]|nr:phospho-N-acetylmuramoyl-pentapeptide-transferase [Chloroflexota bacterium]